MSSCRKIGIFAIFSAWRCRNIKYNKMSFYEGISKEAELSSFFWKNCCVLCLIFAFSCNTSSSNRHSQAWSKQSAAQWLIKKKNNIDLNAIVDLFFHQWLFSMMFLKQVTDHKEVGVFAASAVWTDCCFLHPMQEVCVFVKMQNYAKLFRFSIHNDSFVSESAVGSNHTIATHARNHLCHHRIRNSRSQ